MDEIKIEEWITSDIECKKELIPSEVDSESLEMDGCESQEFVNCTGIIESHVLDESQEYTGSACPEDPKAVWYEAPTRLLLSLVKELTPNVGKSVELNTKKKMWQHIHQQFIQAGYLFTGPQIEHKYRGMERIHKKNKANAGRMFRKVYAYENDIEKIMSKKRHIEIEKRKIAAEAGANCKKKENVVDPIKGVRKGQLRNTEILDELKQMRKDKEAFYASVIRLMEQKAERDEQKLELMRQILDKQ